MKRKIKMVEQTEHSECGLACATMILNYEGVNISLKKTLCYSGEYKKK